MRERVEGQPAPSFLSKVEEEEDGPAVGRSPQPFAVALAPTVAGPVATVRRNGGVGCSVGGVSATVFGVGGARNAGGEAESGTGVPGASQAGGVVVDTPTAPKTGGDMEQHGTGVVSKEVQPRRKCTREETARAAAVLPAAAGQMAGGSTPPRKDLSNTKKEE